MSSEHPRRILAKIEHHASRKLGQNFLLHAQLADELIESCKLIPDCGVLEIGPGLGAMTEILERKVPWLVALELDPRLSVYLQEKFAAAKNVKIIQGDALKVDYQDLFPDRRPFQVVANLPYNQATEILFHLLTWVKRIPRLGIMVQKEVGERLIAKTGTKAYGRLSILPSIYYEILAVKTIGGTQFFPETQVSSQFLRFSRREKPLVDLSHQEFAQLFERVLVALFMWRRKTLRNALTRSGILSACDWDPILNRSNIDGMRRGETLEIAEIEKLTHEILNVTLQSAVFT